MAFLDNSGDIILDAVLTDEGRKILAKGDGSFQITKFALGDEEIDYSLYNTSHASGSAYYDIEILQTPILESFTNNASSMKTKLVSYQSMNLLYLPILKVNQNNNSTKMHSSGSFFVAVDEETEGTDNAGTNSAVGFIGSDPVIGILFGETLSNDQYIRVDQGLDTTAISPKQTLSADLIEDSYILQIDNRLGSIVTVNGDRVSVDYVDDDNIAFYTVDRSDGIVIENNDDTNSSTQTIAGPRGTTLQFKIAASLNLNTSTYLFTQLGGTFTMINKASANQNVRYIDTILRATGVKTGYTVDIPVRFIKTITS